jgi:uncharacterized OB-fold protein
MSRPAFRVLPAVTPENEHFWRGGAEGELRFQSCSDCRTIIHPPAPVCPSCLGRSSVIRSLSGRGVVHTYSINHQPWIPGFDPPYVVAIVELEEQPGLRLTTNIVNCEVEDVHVDLPVRVCFEERDDGIFIPLFEPDPTRTETPMQRPTPMSVARSDR